VVSEVFLNPGAEELRVERLHGASEQLGPGDPHFELHRLGPVGQAAVCFGAGGMGE
jgi:hypothetical protein